MTPDDLTDELAKTLPGSLSSDLVSYYVSIRRDTATRTVGMATPGKFVETVVQILQYLEKRTWDISPKVDGYLKGLENGGSSLPGDLRLTLQRVVRGMYTMRNKRNIAHKGEIDANVYDLRYLFFCAQWVMSEIIRHVAKTDMAAAGRFVDFVQLPLDTLVEDFGERRLVLNDGTAHDELLALLHSYYPDTVPTSQIHRDMDRRPPSTVSNAIRAAYDDRLVEGNSKRGYKLTVRGYDRAMQLIDKISV